MLSHRWPFPRLPGAQKAISAPNAGREALKREMSDALPSKGRARPFPRFPPIRGRIFDNGLRRLPLPDGGAPFRGERHGLSGGAELNGGASAALATRAKPSRSRRVEAGHRGLEK
jgi:hypothetical protein